MSWKKPLIYGFGGCALIFGILSIIGGIMVLIDVFNSSSEPPQPSPRPPVEDLYTEHPGKRSARPPIDEPPPTFSYPQPDAQTTPPHRQGEQPAHLGDATVAREVWLYDSELGMPFCRVAVPGDWQVEGNVAWNPNMPLSPNTIWMRFSNRRLGVTAEVMQEVGTFTWQDMLERLTGLKDGTYLTDTGMFMLKYRTARAALEEFIVPLVARMNPRTRVAWVRDSPEGAEAMRRNMMAKMRASGGNANWDTSEFTAATMLVEDGTRKTLFITYTMGFLRRMPMNNYYHWEWPILIALTTTGDATFSEQDLSALMRFITVNPEWDRRTGSIFAALQNRGAAKITILHERAREAIRQSSDVTEKWTGKWSDYIRDESNYAAPSGQIFKGPSTKNFGYLNGFGDAVMFSDKQIDAANLNGYSEMLRLD